MMHPNEDRVTLKAIAAEEKTAGGLYKPVESQKIELWEVVEIGDSSQKCKVCGTKRETTLQPGMIVYINETAGLDYSYEGDFRVVRFSDIHIYDEKARFDFVKYLSGLEVKPETIDTIVEYEGDKFIVNEHKGKRIAIDLECITGITIGKGGRRLEPKEIMEIYTDTGVLLYRKTQEMHETYSPVAVIDK